MSVRLALRQRQVQRKLFLAACVMISLVLVFLFYRFDEFTAIATIPLQVMPW